MRMSKEPNQDLHLAFLRLLLEIDPTLNTQVNEAQIFAKQLSGFAETWATNVENLDVYEQKLHHWIHSNILSNFQIRSTIPTYDYKTLIGQVLRKLYPLEADLLGNTIFNKIAEGDRNIIQLQGGSYTDLSDLLSELMNAADFLFATSVTYLRYKEAQSWLHSDTKQQLYYDAVKRLKESYVNLTDELKKSAVIEIEHELEKASN